MRTFKLPEKQGRSAFIFICKRRMPRALWTLSSLVSPLMGQKLLKKKNTSKLEKCKEKKCSFDFFTAQGATIL